jgi:hypothetical protein
MVFLCSGMLYAYRVFTGVSLRPTRIHNLTLDAALINSVINNLSNCINAVEPVIAEAVLVLRSSSQSDKESEHVTLKDLEAKHISDLINQ